MTVTFTDDNGICVTLDESDRRALFRSMTSEIAFTYRKASRMPLNQARTELLRAGDRVRRLLDRFMGAEAGAGHGDDTAADLEADEVSA
jgi:hypothetical protein